MRSWLRFLSSVFLCTLSSSCASPEPLPLWFDSFERLPLRSVTVNGQRGWLLRQTRPGRFTALVFGSGNEDAGGHDPAAGIGTTLRNGADGLAPLDTLAIASSGSASAHVLTDPKYLAEVESNLTTGRVAVAGRDNSALAIVPAAGAVVAELAIPTDGPGVDRKSTRLNSSHRT